MSLPTQEEFDLTIGRLDRVISLLILWAKNSDEWLDEPNKQTLKHHAEDMMAASHTILNEISK